MQKNQVIQAGGMKLTAIVGSYRKGKTIDSLVDQAIEGAKSARSDLEVKKICLIDRRIEYCRGCLFCMNDDPRKEIAACVIQDDMQEIYRRLQESDAFIFGTPVNMAHETAVMKTFLERICWVMAKPGRYPFKGCPAPRGARKKKAIIIVSSGLIPPLFRCFCDEATGLIKDVCRFALNARTVGSLYAGAAHRRGADFYFPKAFALGRKLVG